MNLIQKVARWALSKAVGFPSWNAAGPWPSCVISAFGGGGDSVMQLSTVYGCVRVRGQTLGSLPCSVYKRGPDHEMTELRDHWLWPILHDSPDKYRTHFEFFELMERSFCLWGNAYAVKARMGGRIVGLNYLDPALVNVRWDMFKGLVYTYSFFGKYSEYGPDDMLHVKNFSTNGLWGDSPIRNYAINHAIEAQDYGRFFLQNMGRPSGYLKFKGKRPANEEAAAKMRADWQAVHGGTQNAGKTGVLWDSAEYIPISIPPEDAQYIQTRAFSTQEIAGGIFGVPLNLIGQTDKTATYASAEQFDLGYTKHTVRPQARRFEEAIKKALLATEPDTVVEFDLEEMQRGDTAALANLASTLTQNGIATRNEMRPKFNLPRVENPAADELTLQVNMQTLDRLNAPLPDPTQPAPPAQPDQTVAKYVLVDRRKHVEKLQ